MVWEESIRMKNNNFASTELEKINEELKELKELEEIEEIGHLSNANPFSFTQHHVSSSQYIEIQSLPKKGNNKVTIALISLPRLKIKLKKYQTVESNKLRNVDNAIDRELVSYTKKQSNELLSAFKQSIKYAITKYHANILCINELGLPLNVSSKKNRVWQIAIDYAKQMAEDNTCLIFAGSAHDHATYLNTAHMFYPGCDKYGVSYHKQVSAHHEHELISVSPKRKSIHTIAFGLKIGFLTCLDIADYSAVTPLVKLDHKLDILLVPTYTTFVDTLIKAAHIICQAICGYVGFINYNFKNSDNLPSRLFRFGRVSSQRAYKSYEHPNSLFCIKIHQINTNDLRKLKTRHAGNINDKIKWLFGFPQLKKV